MDSLFSLDTSLNALNAGDFAAYRQLYAERFDGIKRMGERVRKFDRAAWLADRERMFEQPTSGVPMRVELTDTRVTLSASTARLRFVQRFARGTFSDRGPKELLVRQAGALGHGHAPSSSLRSRECRADATHSGPAARRCRRRR